MAGLPSMNIRPYAPHEAPVNVHVFGTKFDATPTDAFIKETTSVSIPHGAITPGDGDIGDVSLNLAFKGVEHSFMMDP